MARKEIVVEELVEVLYQWHKAVNLTCKRCIFYEDYRISTMKRILIKQLYQLPLSEEITE